MNGYMYVDNLQRKLQVSYCRRDYFQTVYIGFCLGLIQLTENLYGLTQANIDATCLNTEIIQLVAQKSSQCTDQRGMER